MEFLILPILLGLGLAALISGGGEDEPTGETPSLTEGNDTFQGGDGDDVIDGGKGFDLLLGGNGDDVINGGLGKDTIDGEGGDDTITGGDWNDSINGGSGDDDIFGDNGKDSVSGGAGNDYIEGGAGKDTLDGDDGTDFIDGGDDADRLSGGGDNDVILGGDSGNGQDFLWGRSGNDLLLGGAGDDQVFGGTGDDILVGSDVISLNPDALALQRGEIDLSDLTEPLIMFEEEDAVDRDTDNLYGGDGDDLIALGGNDNAFGGAGADTFVLGIDWIGDASDNVDIRDMNVNEDQIIIGYDADDGPPVLTYELEVNEVNGDKVLVYANGSLIAGVQSETGPAPEVTIANVSANIQVQPINPPDGR